MSPVYTPGKLLLRKTWQPMDPDAAAYITAVEAADTAAGQSGGLEERTKIAIDNFVLGCKADGIWSAIKASCILAGARTLTGALVPLVGSAPTNVSNLFVSDDYNRKTGLVGNGSTKYLDTNRNQNADPQDSFHLAISATVTSGVLAGGNNNTANSSMLSSSVRCRTSIADTVTTGSGFSGINRSEGPSFIYRSNNATSTFIRASLTPANQNTWILRSANVYGNSRIAFYSIGESLNLACLDARVTDLINAFGVAIP